MRCSFSESTSKRTLQIQCGTESPTPKFGPRICLRLQKTLFIEMRMRMMRQSREFIHRHD